MNRTKERGVALILALILLLVLSVMAVSLMFLSQTETWSSMSYRIMSQARGGAEAGVNKAANFLMSTGYTPPGGAGDPLTNYILTASPVTYAGNPVVLSANSTVLSNYPLSAAQSNFNTAGQGSLTAGNSTVNYTSSAKLLSMQRVTPYGSTTPVTIQTWEITSDGTISGLRNAQVEVSAILEQPISPVFNYAAFATSNGCSALTFGGGGTTDSYDSGAVVNGVGACTAGNVTAWTDNQGRVTGGLVELPQPVVYPTPVIPAPGTTNLSIDKNWKCPTGASVIPGCTSSGGNIYLPPGAYGNLDVTGNTNLHVSAGTYNINSFQEQSAQSSLIIDSGPVIFNVTGNNVSGAVVDLTGNSVQNSSLNPMNFQILYAGTGAVKLAGNSQAAALLYAPNASFSFTGQGSWYGAVIGNNLTDMGGAAIHYDRRLQRNAYTVGNYMLSSFTWKKY